MDPTFPSLVFAIVALLACLAARPTCPGRFPAAGLNAQGKVCAGACLGVTALRYRKYLMLGRRSLCAEARSCGWDGGGLVEDKG